jgi:hypothetical protein
MTYELRTVDGQFKRKLNDDDFYTILRMALTHGWKPSPRHYVKGRLRMDVPLLPQEAKEFAAAIDRSIQQDGATLLPPVIITFLECIGVLRRGESQFVLL